jgi:hypothetical protein
VNSVVTGKQRTMTSRIDVMITEVLFEYRMEDLLATVYENLKSASYRSNPSRKIYYRNHTAFY